MVHYDDGCKMRCGYLLLSSSGSTQPRHQAIRKGRMGGQVSCIGSGNCVSEKGKNKHCAKLMRLY